MTLRPIGRIACVGEVMIELIAAPDGAARLGVAGDTYNTAVYIARALRGTGIDVSYVTALGSDPYSARIVADLGRHGLRGDLVARIEGATPGLYAIDTDAQGERSFTYWRSASAARSMFSPLSGLQPSDLDAFDLVYLSGISLAILPPAAREALLSWAETFRARGGRVAYDSNHRPRLWESADVARAVNARAWSVADIALPSIDDEMALHGDTSEEAVIARLRALGAVRGALKRGAAGPVSLSDGAGLDPAPAPVRVVDTTAAGDSFNAGYLAALAQGEGEAAAMRAGHALAARVVGHRGAILPEDA